MAVYGRSREERCLPFTLVGFGHGGQYPERTCSVFVMGLRQLSVWNVRQMRWTKERRMINVGTSSRTPKVAAIREVVAGLGSGGRSTDDDDDGGAVAELVP